MQGLHLVARLAAGGTPQLHPAGAWSLWRALRRRFPAVVAATVMPDHIHLLLPAGPPDAARAALARALSGCSRARSCAHRWVTAEPSAVADLEHLRRTVRYLYLNAPRAGHVADPLGWPWSTYRGVMGAEIEPWISASRLARAVGRPATGFREWLHRYVSSDPAVATGGTEPPHPFDPGARSRPDLALVARAAASATPWSTRAQRRHSTALLARACGFWDAPALAEMLEISTTHVRRLARWDARWETPEHVEALLLCLGDDRLLLDAPLTPPTTLARRVRRPP